MKIRKTFKNDVKNIAKFCMNACKNRGQNVSNIRRGDETKVSNIPHKISTKLTSLVSIPDQTQGSPGRALIST